MIDEDSLERYGKEPGEFGKILRNSIDWEEECFYQNNRRCAFFNDENLCDLYKTLGPDALCDTCRMYPRHTEEYEGLRELSLSLSCPEAAKIILSCKEPVRFLEEETDEEDDFEEFDFMMFSQLEDTRDVLFSILQDRSLPLTLRMSASKSQSKYRILASVYIADMILEQAIEDFSALPQIPTIPILIHSKFNLQRLKLQIGSSYLTEGVCFA